MARTLLSTLGALGLGLLNATLILVFAAALTTWLALGRIDTFVARTAETVAAALAPQGERLERIAVAVEGIEARLDDPALGAELRAEIAGLRTDLAETRAGLAQARDAAPKALATATLEAIRDLLPAAR